MIKYKNNNRYIYNNIAFFYFYKGYGFTIEYLALEKYFDRFLPDMERMIESFEIKE